MNIQGMLSLHACIVGRLVGWPGFGVEDFVCFYKSTVQTNAPPGPSGMPEALKPTLGGTLQAPSELGFKL